MDRRVVCTRGALGVILVAATALRVWHLGAASYWLDEAFTVRVADGNLAHLFRQLAASESTPPLYYLVVWAWGHVLGFGDVTIRAVSVLAGLGTIVFAGAAARQFASPRIGLITAALVAVDPYLVWYSREARSYSLYACLAALTLWLLARAVHDRSSRAVITWAIAAAAATATHYFAVFLVLPEGVILASMLRGRELRVALAAFIAVLAAAASLAPLAISQMDDRTAWIADVSVTERLGEFPAHLLLGFHLPDVHFLTLASAAAIVVGGVIVWLLVTRRGSIRERRVALAGAGVACAIVIQPIVAGLIGHDVFVARNVLVAGLPLAAALACGLGAARLRPAVSLALTGAVCALLLAATWRDVSGPPMNRTSWRRLAASFGEPVGTRVDVIAPRRRHLGVTQVEFTAYRADAHPIPHSGVTTSELYVAERSRARHASTSTTSEGFPGFVVASRRTVGDFTVTRYRAREPVHVTQALLEHAAGWPSVGASVLVECLIRH